MASQDKPSPFVFWAQSENAISLRADLKNVKSPDVRLTNNSLEFTAFGTGARGDHEYDFKLHFFGPINPQESRFRVSDRQIDFHIEKEVPKMWPRLMQQTNKPAWLKFDFDKFTLEDEDDVYEDELDDSETTQAPYNEMLRDLSKSKRRKEKRIQEFRKVYLFLYNLFEFVGFLYVLIVMSIRYIKDGAGSMESTFDTVGRAFKFCQLLQLMEVIHPLLGYTKGSAFVPLIQIAGRIIILFPMIDFEERMHGKPVVFYLFLVWSIPEIIRYPYYMLKLYNSEIAFITWLRYSCWIILYPIGFLCEGVIILRNIPYYEETQRLSLALPNALNISFHCPTVMRLYLLVGLFPVMYFMMTHLYRQRVKMIGPKSWIKKD